MDILKKLEEIRILKKLEEISKYLSNETPYNRIPDVRQYTHFVRGLYIVQGIPNLKFSYKFLKWLDDNEIKNVSVQEIKANIYAIVVEDN